MKLKPQSDKNKKILEKERRFCGCNHKDPDYWCVCWMDGFETADSENCFEKLQEEREKTIEEYKGQTKRIAYQQGYQEAEKKMREEMDEYIAYCECGDALDRTGLYPHEARYYCMGDDSIFVLKLEKGAK